MRDAQRGVLLIGLPGTGKSTIGRQVARRLGRGFLDSDVVIEQRLGESIREFFEREGEPAFRDIESSVLEELTQPGSAPMVVATGGGIVLRERNRERLRTCGERVIYLRSSPQDLHRRLRHDTTRPLLQVADPLARLRELYEVRDPLYREVAHFVIDTGRPSVAALVNMIAMQLELGAAPPPA
ncbi:shikimate kinase [Xylophilus sp.]|uniref:shikimate kinase n=1 Tax=Xylophilus sp. TaxID=2653893 RepID=UPI0013BE572B|nr:shikimate kinase [Xylophilus sp.]KAF1044267.1 MAG: Shikimate kinase 1 [Xylophilus sp.]